MWPRPSRRSASSGGVSNLAKRSNQAVRVHVVVIPIPLRRVAELVDQNWNAALANTVRRSSLRPARSPGCPQARNSGGIHCCFAKASAS